MSIKEWVWPVAILILTAVCLGLATKRFGLDRKKWIGRFFCDPD